MHDAIELADKAERAKDSRLKAFATHQINTLPILVLHVHSSCNCRCVMCDIWKTSESQTLRPGDLEPHLNSIRKLGVRWIVFSGGEPLLNTELPKLCSMLRSENIRLTLLTTGLLLTKYAANVAANFDDVIVSLDGPERIHNAIRCINSAFALLGEGIAAVRTRRPTLRITARTTVQKANHCHLRETLQAAKSLELNAISFLAADLTSTAFNRPSPWPKERQSQVDLSLEELKELEIEMESLIQENGVDFKNRFISESPEKLRRIVRHFRAHLGLERNESPLCNAPWVSAVIETDGTVRPCFFHHSIGNLKEKNLADVINGEEALAFRSTLDIPNDLTCNHCVCSLNYRKAGLP